MPKSLHRKHSDPVESRVLDLEYDRGLYVTKLTSLRIYHHSPGEVMAYNESYSCRKQGFPPSKENLQNGVFPHNTRESGHRYHTLHLNGGVLRGGSAGGPEMRMFCYVGGVEPPSASFGARHTVTKMRRVLGRCFGTKL